MGFRERNRYIQLCRENEHSAFYYDTAEAVSYTHLVKVWDERHVEIIWNFSDGKAT